MGKTQSAGKQDMAKNEEWLCSIVHGSRGNFLTFAFACVVYVMWYVAGVSKYSKLCTVCTFVSFFVTEGGDPPLDLRSGGHPRSRPTYAQQ